MAADQKDQKELWKDRAVRYNNLEWVNNKSRLGKLIEIGEFKESDVVLDVGTGTGKIACTLAPLVKEVHGLDISKDMLDQIDTSNFNNIILKEGTVSNSGYSPDFFDKITARLIFHHILDDKELKDSVSECHRILKPGGKIVISEGVPPAENVKQDFINIFKLKEDRRTFMESDIKNLLEEAGFKNVKIHMITQEEMSVNNWLDNDGTLSEEAKKKIKDLHRFSSEEFKKAYNLKDLGHDMLIDIKVAKVVGEK